MRKLQMCDTCATSSKSSQINFNIWNQENVLCMQFFQSFLRNGEDKIEGIVCL